MIYSTNKLALKSRRGRIRLRMSAMQLAALQDLTQAIIDLRLENKFADMLPVLEHWVERITAIDAAEAKKGMRQGRRPWVLGYRPLTQAERSARYRNRNQK